MAMTNSGRIIKYFTDKTNFASLETRLTGPVLVNNFRTVNVQYFCDKEISVIIEFSNDGAQNTYAEHVPIVIPAGTETMITQQVVGQWMQTEVTNAFAGATTTYRQIVYGSFSDEPLADVPVTNIGTGAELVNEANQEVRSLLSSDTSVILTENANDVDVQIHKDFPVTYYYDPGDEKVTEHTVTISNTTSWYLVDVAWTGNNDPGSQWSDAIPGAIDYDGTRTQWFMVTVDVIGRSTNSSGTPNTLWYRLFLDAVEIPGMQGAMEVENVVVQSTSFSGLVQMANNNRLGLYVRNPDNTHNALVMGVNISCVAQPTA